MLGKIIKIEEVFDIESDYSSKDGYKVVTDKNTYCVLIDNHQSCCESWGYMSSDDDLEYYVGSELLGVKLTDKALNTQMIEKSGYYEDGGGIQFIDFITNLGHFQLAVYNAHNGYYGHGVLITKDEEVMFDDYL